jgi:acyl-coenzyme A thioesterase PaaI-like protein
MKERRRLHQHLRSVHAGALFTFAECTSGLAMAASIPDTMRIIVTDISIEFKKKAHGLLIAEARCEIPDAEIEQRHEVEVRLSDEQGDSVAVATVQWLVGPARRRD